MSASENSAGAADDDVKILHAHGLCAGTVAAPEAFFQLRDFLLDHLHPRRAASIRWPRPPPAPAAPRIGIGWPIGVLISGVFGLAMAQIASAFPTAGGLYHWGSILGNRFTGWLTAWFNLLGWSRCSARSTSAPTISSSAPSDRQLGLEDSIGR